MSLRPLFALMLAGLVALPVGAQSPAQQGGYRVAGTVVSIVDSHPLQRATVDLLAPDDARTVLESTFSDEYGRFAFTGVPAGNHILRGETRGYFPTQYDQHEGFTTGIVTGAGVDTESLVLKLVPQAAIAGTVRDENGDAVPNAGIHLFRPTPGLGDGKLLPADSASTDDRGHFEIPRLEPGNYFLVIAARPWYARSPSPVRPNQFVVNGTGVRVVPLGGQQPYGIADSIDPALDSAYPAVFYPGTTDPAAAAPIPLHGGESLDLSFSLSSVPAISLTVPIAKGVSPEQQLVLSFRGQSIPVDSNERQSNGQTILTGIAPGDYRLYSPPNSGAPSALGSLIHIDRTASLADLPALAGPAHLHAVLHSADGSPLPAHLQLGLILNSNSADEVFTAANPKGEVTLGAPPGFYSFEATANGRPLSIRQSICDAKPLPGNQLHLASDQTAACSIFIGPANHVLRGYARREGKPSAGAFVLMFPSEQIGGISNASRDQTNLDGSFELTGLGAGAYTLIAIDGGWDVDWRRPEVLAHYLPGAITVHIADSNEKIQSLREALPVQPR